ncbi:hypothetical protein SAMN02745866_04032 [Alteromonadaceae bacterium Bs31]|nr:hypothetical protein SAMN02745866_04032 [Alteromonadaceae bacterium Bs31]
MLKRLLTFTLVLACFYLSGCNGNTAVYGGVSVGSSWGGHSSSRPNTRMSISVSGRIR